MTPREKRQANIAQYLTQAEAARVAATGSSLDQVRRKHELAAARWEELAAIAVRDVAIRDARLSNVRRPLRIKPTLQSREDATCIA